MAYEVFKSTGNGVPLARGMATIARNGRGRYSAADLRAVGIHQHATILIDRKRKRIGVRAPKECESARTVKHYDRKLSPDIWIGGALLAIGVKPGDVAGTHEVIIEDGVITIDLSEADV